MYVFSNGIWIALAVGALLLLLVALLTLSHLKAGRKKKRRKGRGEHNNRIDLFAASKTQDEPKG